MAKRSFLEKLGDVVFILTCVGLLSAAVYRAVPARAVRGASVDASRIGSPAVLPPVDFSASPRTVLAVVSTSCRFCDASMPFYRQLASEDVGSEGWSLVFVGIEAPADVTSYLEANGVPAVSVVQLTPSLAIRGTPTLLVVDASGHILGAWSGVLDEQQQNEVRTLIAG
ncbi:MAG TPA: hypothetical protein VGD94_22955 [Vicinamibacterales bacterium]